MSIKNIIFDLGAVLLNIDYNKTSDAFKQLGYTDFEKMYSQFKGNNIFDNLETGHLSKSEFYKYMLGEGTGLISEDEVAAAWNAMLLDFRTESLAFLKQLSKKYKLFLLSNTNEIHKTAFDIIYTKQVGEGSFDEFFTKAYYSHKVGLRKPNEDIFNFILEDAGIKPEETMFIDDLAANIETAARLGFKTHRMLPGERIENLRFEV